MVQQVALRSYHLSLFTMMMALIRLNLKRFIMDHKAYMYVLECRDGSYYTGYTTDVRKRLAVHNSGKEPNTHEHACQSNSSMLKVLPVRKKPCRQKPFSNARRGHRRKDFYLKIKIEKIMKSKSKLAVILTVVV